MISVSNSWIIISGDAAKFLLRSISLVANELILTSCWIYGVKSSWEVNECDIYNLKLFLSDIIKIKNILLVNLRCLFYYKFFFIPGRIYGHRFNWVTQLKDIFYQGDMLTINKLTVSIK